MSPNKLFQKTRYRLALWYALTMGGILNGMGWGMYGLVSHYQWQTLYQEMDSVAGTLHDNLEAKLTVAGAFTPAIMQTLPELCLSDQPCDQAKPDRHVLGLSQQPNYYLVFWNLHRQPIAHLGQVPLQQFPDQDWHPLQDAQGKRYQQRRVFLKTFTGEPWGYLVVGRSLAADDQRLATLRWLLLASLPLGMALIGVASWYLAGLAMTPIYDSYLRMEQFSADAAHELRTPVAAICATLEAITEDPDPSVGDVQDTLAALQRQSQRLSHLIQDLLLLCQIHQGAATIPRQRCCLNTIVPDVLNELAVLAMAADLNLQWQDHTHQALYVRGIANQLARVVRNLVQNAIQYTPAGGNILVTLDQQHQEAVLHIQDSGIGIAPADQAKIFDRFYRVDAARGRAKGGAGLGLAIAKAIVEQHQGRLSLKSDVGAGSVFTVALPLA